MTHAANAISNSPYVNGQSAAEDSGDVATMDLATERVTQRRKAAWMLGSILRQ